MADKQVVHRLWKRPTQFNLGLKRVRGVVNAYSNKYVHRYLIYSSYDITVALWYYNYLIW